MNEVPRDPDIKDMLDQAFSPASSGDWATLQAKLQTRSHPFTALRIAALILITVGLIGIFSLWSYSPSSLTVQGKELPLTIGKTIALDQEESGEILLSDGSRIELLDGTWIIPLTVEERTRFRFRLDRGKVQITAAKDKKSLVIETANGNVSVVGTVFSVEVIELPIESQYRNFIHTNNTHLSFTATAVNVTKGAVRIVNKKGSQKVPAGKRGFLISDEMSWISTITKTISEESLKHIIERFIKEGTGRLQTTARLWSDRSILIPMIEQSLSQSKKEKEEFTLGSIALLNFLDKKTAAKYSTLTKSILEAEKQEETENK